ncbi:surface lipoprotein assembly modifier [Futiania mangrovi]|uniref:Surface lipoprotein assembly modifier n=1 Tax=Futiania mangrovi TaxID=2959716 RepID=A0A9J6PMN2_9PROT|nr:surface lipoprotein assembly modifier [Futiania mangrovii]MCP1337314.1 surface lipoprotein assembly modifier [Futiania mangrovii]
MMGLPSRVSPVIFRAVRAVTAGALAVFLALGAGAAGAQTLAEVRALVDAGKAAEARRLLAQVPEPQDPVQRTEFVFLDGLTALELGHPEEAIVRFRRILVDQPGLVRVRLELARAYFEVEDDENARRQFELVLAANLPPAVTANIEAFLDAIRARRKWSLSVTFALAPDTNVNAATDARLVEIGGFPFLLDPNARKTSGLGMLTAAQAGYRLPLAKDWRAEAELYASHRQYDNDDFNDSFLRLGLGPTWLPPGGEVALRGVVRRRWFGNDAYNWGAGGEIAASMQATPRLGLSTRLEVIAQNYDDDRRQDGWVATGSIGARYGISSSAMVRADLTFLRNETEEARFSYDFPGLSVAWLQEFPWGITAEVGGFAGYRDFDGPDPLFASTRKDWRYSGSLYLTKRDWSIGGFAPLVGVRHTINDSDINFYDYDRTELMFGVTRQF